MADVVEAARAKLLVADAEDVLALVKLERFHPAAALLAKLVRAVVPMEAHLIDGMASPPTELE